MMGAKLTKISYSPGGYWKGIAAKKLFKVAKDPKKLQKKVAAQKSALADLPPRAEEHSSAKI